MPSTSAIERYPRIADHGVIGDQRTAALVSIDGTIDFWCAPQPDSPSIFASLLDVTRGGHFAIAPANGTFECQRYVRDTNVLITRFAAEGAEVEVADFMPMERGAPPSRIVRLVTVRGGPATIHVRCAPRFDYARGSHALSIEGGTAELCSERGDRLRLTATVPLGADGQDAIAEARLGAGKRAAFVLEYAPQNRRASWDVRRAARALRRTIVHWRRWVARSAYHGRWSAQVRRSALALALLHSRRTGAIAAAPTFALPERIGGDRNWDFRFCWIRDASLIVLAMARLGLELHGRRFEAWLSERREENTSGGELQSMYGIDGRRVLTEQTLDHLEGYRGSRPVRIGNAAYEQFQLDVYGELLDALYARDTPRAPASRAQWERMVEMVNWVCDNWKRPDHGIWEVRTGAQEFLYSRVMCWVAVDRALRLARRRHLPAPSERWLTARDAIRHDIHESFWSAELGAYVGSKGSDAVDAACLVMPLVGFIEPSEPRWLATLARIEERLVHGAMVRRYDMTGMDTDAGAPAAPAFTICSFWYVSCLARAGRHDQAVRVMERLVAHANHLGLYSEDLGVQGELLGNFPQGLPHAALIEAAQAIAARADRQ